VAHEAFQRGITAAADVLAEARRVVEREPRLRLEYLEAVDPNTLSPVSRVAGDTVVALAARVGTTRLIDNIVLGNGLAGDDWLGRS